MSRPIAQSVRLRYDPLDRARQVPGLRSLLSRADRPVWAALPGIDSPVRLRALRNAWYRFNFSRTQDAGTTKTLPCPSATAVERPT